MVNTLGLPTVFFTHSAADLQWPELACLICPNDTTSTSARNKALQENPAIADWFFHECINKFIDAFYVGILGATDYWMRYEWQHRGSPHVHGIAWFAGAPDVAKVLSSTEDRDEQMQELLRYVDKTVSMINPAVQLNGSDIESAPLPKISSHICNKAYADVVNLSEDLSELPLFSKHVWFSSC